MRPSIRPSVHHRPTDRLAIPTTNPNTQPNPHHNHPNNSQYRDLQAVFLAGALLSFLYTAWPFHLKVCG